MWSSQGKVQEIKLGIKTDNEAELLRFVSWPGWTWPTRWEAGSLTLAGLLIFATNSPIKGAHNVFCIQLCLQFVSQVMFGPAKVKVSNTQQPNRTFHSNICVCVRERGRERARDGVGSRSSTFSELKNFFCCITAEDDWERPLWKGSAAQSNFRNWRNL